MPSTTAARLKRTGPSEGLRRREFLLLGAPAVVLSGTLHLSLLPIYTRDDEPVGRSFIDAVIAALNRVYTLTVHVCAEELYKGSTDGTALLEYLAPRKGLTMAVMSAPLRARVRVGLNYIMKEVSGLADIPNDNREQPRGSIISTHALYVRRGADAERWLGIVAIHELGHNLGAWDCSEHGCYMFDEIDLAHGSVPRQFCPFHEDLLARYLRLVVRPSGR